jgi:hypothetical protein
MMFRRERHLFMNMRMTQNSTYSADGKNGSRSLKNHKADDKYFAMIGRITDREDI